MRKQRAPHLWVLAGLSQLYAGARSLGGGKSRSLVHTEGSGSGSGYGMSLEARARETVFNAVGPCKALMYLCAGCALRSSRALCYVDTEALPLWNLEVRQDLE